MGRCKEGVDRSRKMWEDEGRSREGVERSRTMWEFVARK